MKPFVNRHKSKKLKKQLYLKIIGQLNPEN